MKKLNHLRCFSYICVLFIACGAAARFAWLSASLQYDEVFTAITTNPALSFAWIWRNWLLADVHPPLYNALLWLWHHAAPYGVEMWMRLPSVAFGLAALAYAWLGFPKRFGKTARWIFVTSLTANMWLIFYSQNARAYSLCLLLSLPFTFLFFELFRSVRKNRPVSRRRWLAYGALGCGLTWSHYFGALYFGLCALVLLAAAWRHKRALRPVIGVTALVFVLFLPWLVPNFLNNISYHRFSGNWWASGFSLKQALPGLKQFLFSTDTAYGALGIFCMAGLLRCLKRSSKRIPFLTEISVCLIICVAMMAFVALLSLKVYMFFGRYFTVMLPMCWLALALFFAPLVRKYPFSWLLLVVAWGANLFFAVQMVLWLGAWARADWDARLIAQMYGRQAPGKEIFVIAIEGFPPETMPALYGYYPNTVFKQNARVTELFTLDDAAREEALARRKDAFVFMPNCTVDKILSVQEKWDRGAHIKMNVASNCLLDITDKGGERSSLENLSSRLNSF